MKLLVRKKMYSQLPRRPGQNCCPWLFTNWAGCATISSQDHRYHWGKLLLQGADLQVSLADFTLWVTNKQKSCLTQATSRKGSCDIISICFSCSTMRQEIPVETSSLCSTMRHEMSICENIILMFYNEKEITHLETFHFNNDWRRSPNSQWLRHFIGLHPLCCCGQTRFFLGILLSQKTITV